MHLRWFRGTSNSGADIPAAAVPSSPSVSAQSPLTNSTPNLNLIDDFQIIKGLPPYCKSLDALVYNKNDPGIGTSAHKVIESTDRITNQKHILKFYDNEAMIHAEAFLNHLYSLSLLHGVARCFVRVDANSRPVALSSKKIENFHTFKDKNCQLTAEQLSQPDYRQRFLRILAILLRMHEDDGHSGNITTDLKLFDAGGAYWDVSYIINGGRPLVDNMLNRNPAIAFDFHPDDAIGFPVISRAQPWYNPGLDCKVTSFVTNNPFTPSETALVRELQNDANAMPVFFQEALDWLFDLSPRFPHLARLHFPDSLEVNGENVIHLYCQKDQQIREQYFNVLSELTPLKEWLKKNWRNIMLEILVRCEIRNHRLQQDRLKNPEWDKLFSAAILDPLIILANYNDFVARINDSQILAFSCINKGPGIVRQSVFLGHSFFIANPSDNIEMLHPFVAHELITEAKIIAEDLIAKEQQLGTEEWKQFLPDNKKSENKFSFPANISLSP